MGIYRIAEVCPNGHVSTDSADVHPELREAFCSRCGEATITACPSCHTNIRGDYQVGGIFISSEYEPPAFCFNCGSPFPWTERKISGAIELVKEGGRLTEGELSEFKDDLNEMTKGSPRVQAASARFKKVMSKVGTSVAGGVREIVVDVLSEAAKKAIWG
ncbi:hypothetical protein MIZ01_0285 [Sideroxyarcus emersonii]|uniref:DUF2321 domain-containing protein n=1 Tax=Sideroxyarcus emersonii TaxID=2764705 RepID=A0AAN1X8L9_9PROT|nr:DUF2321 domain-containing protein [Sideroxyarcus emersonii]BCK86523.1 hypothetical protein MIZ01_0285 [Sideroxyarcus emersonii]